VEKKAELQNPNLYEKSLFTTGIPRLQRQIFLKQRLHAINFEKYFEEYGIHTIELQMSRQDEK